MVVVRRLLELVAVQVRWSFGRGCGRRCCRSRSRCGELIRSRGGVEPCGRSRGRRHRVHQVRCRLDGACAELVVALRRHADRREREADLTRGKGSVASQLEQGGARYQGNRAFVSV